MKSQCLYIGPGQEGDPLMEALTRTKQFDFQDAVPTASDLESRELVVEVLPDEERKRETLRAIAQCRDWQGTVASMMEKDSATHWALQSGLGKHFVGFLIPPGAGKGPAVELLKGEMTSQEAVDCAAEIFRELGWHVTTCRDQAGGILFRVLAGMINEAAFMAQSAIAPVDQIDRMMRLAANFPLGPFEWADRIGLDRLLALLEKLSREFGPIYQPCPMIRRKVEAGKLGQMTGEGFYKYSEGGAA